MNDIDNPQKMPSISQSLVEMWKGILPFTVFVALALSMAALIIASLDDSNQDTPDAEVVVDQTMLSEAEAPERRAEAVEAGVRKALAEAAETETQETPVKTAEPTAEPEVQETEAFRGEIPLFPEIYSQSPESTNMFMLMMDEAIEPPPIWDSCDHQEGCDWTYEDEPSRETSDGFSFPEPPGLSAGGGAITYHRAKR